MPSSERKSLMKTCCNGPGRPKGSQLFGQQKGGQRQAGLCAVKKLINQVGGGDQVAFLKALLATRWGQPLKAELFQATLQPLAKGLKAAYDAAPQQQRSQLLSICVNKDLKPALWTKLAALPNQQAFATSKA
ncbi:hypothetical protein QOT17_008599 [Balamuthia mandrillaris]